jgi:hypothetical protein
MPKRISESLLIFVKEFIVSLVSFLHRRRRDATAIRAPPVVVSEATREREHYLCVLIVHTYLMRARPAKVIIASKVFFRDLTASIRFRREYLKK